MKRWDITLYPSDDAAKPKVAGWMRVRYYTRSIRHIDAVHVTDSQHSLTIYSYQSYFPLSSDCYLT